MNISPVIAKPIKSLQLVLIREFVILKYVEGRKPCHSAVYNFRFQSACS